MSIKSGLFGAITTVVLILALGSRWAADNAPSGGPAPATGRQVTTFFSWDPDVVFDDFRTATYVGLLVLVVATFVLGGLVGRARPLAAFIGGWGAAMGAAAVSGMVFALIAGERAGFRGPGGKALDRMVFFGGQGATAMIVVGWLVGLAVLLGSFGAKQPKVARPTSSSLPPPGPDPYGPPQGAGGFGPAAAPPPGSGGYGHAPAPAPPEQAPPAASGGPHIGAPPDRTQVQPRPPS